MPNKHKQKKEKRQKGGNDGEASIGIVTYRPATNAAISLSGVAHHAHPPNPLLAPIQVPALWLREIAVFRPGGPRAITRRPLVAGKVPISARPCLFDPPISLTARVCICSYSSGHGEQHVLPAAVRSGSLVGLGSGVGDAWASSPKGHHHAHQKRLEPEGRRGAQATAPSHRSSLQSHGVGVFAR
jgi:hypothetical protein